MESSVKKFSAWSLARNALTGHHRWPRQWRSPEPKPAYDVVIIGGGGHGLATAYYLAKNHGVINVAVLEKGWLGGGNTGRNTTIVRSNYLWDESTALYEHSLKLWESLSRELNYNVMFSQRGVVNLAHNPGDVRAGRRRVEANRLNGVDSGWLTPGQLRRRCPILNTSSALRYPVMGGTFQPRGGTARHDAVAWGFARAADDCGVDIVQNCEVTGIRRTGGRVAGVETTRGFIAARKVAIVTAGHSSVLAEMAGFRLPIQSHPLQALVSEPIKPVLDTVVMSGAIHVYVSQSDKGELVIGGATDPSQSFRQDIKQTVFEDAVSGLLDLFPAFKRLKLLRQWGGALDFAHDSSPIVSKTGVPGLYVTCGWWGGFKAIPAGGLTLAHLIAKDEPHELIAPFSLDRFRRLDFILETGTTAAR